MQGNRIDSRARGNAPQLLDKYKKLAHEAQLNDDRVQTEYYLQFADHYFRVIADNKAQKEEAQAKRNGERGKDNSSDEDDDGQDDRQNDRKPRGRKGTRKGDGDQRQAREGDSGEQGEDDNNPFTRDTAKPKARKPRKKKEEAVADDGDSLDLGVLPPAIARADDVNEGEEKPRKKLGTRRKPKDDSPKDDGEETLKAVG